MGYPRAAAAALLCTAFLSSCGESALAPRGEVAAAEDAISAWVARHPDGWNAATTTDAILTRPAWTPSCSDPASNGYVSLRLVSGRGDIELSFRCPVDERATAEQLQVHFIHAVPWNLPTGINSPNWRFQAWLPLSAVFNGVTFETPSAGQLAIDIQSTMSGIRAENTRRGCVAAAVADAALEPSCVIAREHRVPMRLRFTVRADLSALR
jgi:hypothetical protein